MTDWQGDLSAPWREFLDEVELDYDAVRADLELHAGELIFPGRRGNPVPGAPPQAHVFRAFDGIAPPAVRAVVLGQDPYPNRAQATGRSFEQGDLVEVESLPDKHLRAPRRPTWGD